MTGAIVDLVHATVLVFKPRDGMIEFMVGR